MTGMGSTGGAGDAGGEGGAILADDGHESSLMPASSGTGMQGSGSDADEQPKATATGRPLHLL